MHVQKQKHDVYIKEDVEKSVCKYESIWWDFENCGAYLAG